MFVSPNVHRDRARRLSMRAGINLTSDLGRYLGISAINGRITKERYQQLISRIQSKLAAWKTKHLSVAARITLVNSVSSSMIIYSMFTEKLPVSVCKNIDRINRQFVWGEEEGKTHFHPVAWEHLTRPRDQGGVGIRPTRLANQAMLAKGAWKIVTGDSTLWAKALRSKYGGNRQRLQILSKRKGGSFIWNSFAQSADLLRKGAAMNVKNGQLTKFWTDVWILQIPLIEAANQEIPMEERIKNVADYWDEDDGWKLHEFEDFLPEEIIDKVRATMLDPLSSSRDTLFWKATANGLFTASSAYKARCPEPDQQHSTMWQRIWKLHCPERVRFFIWLAAKEKLSTNWQQKVRHLTNDDKCPICSDAIETNIHCLRDCPAAKKIWERLVPGQKHQTFFTSEHTDWFYRNIKETEGEGGQGNWPSLFALVCWFIWKYRNDFIFRGKRLVESSFSNYVRTKATSWLEAWERADQQLQINSKPERMDQMVGWVAPPNGWMKLNSDGAAQGINGLATAGGVLRDKNDNWKGGFCCKIGTGSAILAELWGIHQGLILARNHGVQFLILETNSKLAIDLIKNREDPVHPHSTILNAIRRLLTQDWVVQLVHTYREGNRVADWLSKHGLVYPFGVHELANPPSELSRILTDDTLGVSFPRMVIRTQN
ncbi:unnamed protein product [Linum trigynum]|uniref:RNase H type-1 domain-containing protein n=1 Tax=Linum trigynum TaxID=586398 RepID=A0AAV2CJY1_9ROSI